MRNVYRKEGGFTVVELAVVIIVIAVLAAISVVVYRGVTDRANDVAVQDMIANLDDQATSSAAFADTGACPIASRLEYDRDSKAYDRSIRNIFYIHGSSASIGCTYALVIVSASGKAFYTSTSTDKIQEYGGPPYVPGDFAMQNYFTNQFGGWSDVTSVTLSILHYP